MKVDLETQLLEKLPSEPFEALEQLVSEYFAAQLERKHDSVPGEHDKRGFREAALRYSIAARLLMRRSNLGLNLTAPNPDLNYERFFHNTEQYFNNIQALLIEARINRELVSKDPLILSADGFAYNLDADDMKTVQNKINELRQAIQQADFLEERFKRRLLIRLEKMQSELHKEISDFDIILGGVADAADTMGHVGEKAKPIVDRFRDIMEVFWRNRTGASEIEGPDELPKLPGAES